MVKGDAWQSGTTEPLALLVSEEAHYCIDRAVKVMGWGEGGVIKVPTDEHFKLPRRPVGGVATNKRKPPDRQVIAVVGSACTTSTGSYDPLAAMADFCEQHNLWFPRRRRAHGAPVAFSPDLPSFGGGVSTGRLCYYRLSQDDADPGHHHRAGVQERSGFVPHTSRNALATCSTTTKGSGLIRRKRAPLSSTKRMMSVQVYAILRTYGPKIFERERNAPVRLSAARLARMIEERPTLQLALAPDSEYWFASAT